MGTVPIWISAFTPLNRPFPGAKLDVPRLAAPRGPARGRARANRPSLSYRMIESHSSMHVLRPKSSRAEELLALLVDLPKSSSTCIAYKLHM